MKLGSETVGYLSCYPIFLLLKWLSVGAVWTYRRRCLRGMCEAHGKEMFIGKESLLRGNMTCRAFWSVQRTFNENFPIWMLHQAYRGKVHDFLAGVSVTQVVGCKWNLYFLPSDTQKSMTHPVMLPPLPCQFMTQVLKQPSLSVYGSYLNLDEKVANSNWLLIVSFVAGAPSDVGWWESVMPLCFVREMQCRMSGWKGWVRAG